MQDRKRATLGYGISIRELRAYGRTQLKAALYIGSEGIHGT